MTGWQLVRSGWELEPSVVAGSGALLAAYLAAVRFRPGRTTWRFVAGVAVMIVALVSPLDGLADGYLFSAHMLQHLLLDFIAPPLFVLGLPEDVARGWLRRRPAAAVERVLRRPAVAWALGIGTLWSWHVPALYDATLAHEGIHILEHLTFLVTGTIFWWPVFTPLAERRLAPLPALLYLVPAAFANALLGIVFTLASTPFYSGYAHPPDPDGALALIRGRWGISQLIDQQLGGAMMWVLGSLIFLAAILVVVRRWYAAAEDDA